MRALVTGGAGFIGSWVVKELIEKENEVYVIDNLINGKKENIEQFGDNPFLKEINIEDIRDKKSISDIFKYDLDVCIHLAASINVHDSIINPVHTYDVDVNGTYYLLEEARKKDVKFVFASTCMVYDTATNVAIDENHPTKAASPYAGAKLAGENMITSYNIAYGLPTVILRPFNTYGPRQLGDEWGGAVIPRFLRMKLDNIPLTIYGDGTQTRDLLYVEDCAKFFVKASESDNIKGEIINAGTGHDISINDLAILIAGDPKKTVKVKHPHPQSEIPKLLSDSAKAKQLLKWEPEISLEEGIKMTYEWIKGERS